jgi:hypothetical protein
MNYETFCKRILSLDITKEAIDADEVNQYRLFLNNLEKGFGLKQEELLELKKASSLLWNLTIYYNQNNISNHENINNCNNFFLNYSETYFS